MAAARRVHACSNRYRGGPGRRPSVSGPCPPAPRIEPLPIAQGGEGCCAQGSPSPRSSPSWRPPEGSPPASSAHTGTPPRSTGPPPPFERPPPPSRRQQLRPPPSTAPEVRPPPGGPPTSPRPPGRRPLVHRHAGRGRRLRRLPGGLGRGELAVH